MSSAAEPQAATPSHTHYDVLRLARDDFSSLSKDDIKAAYRRALLKNHPDKGAGADGKTALKSCSNSTATSTARYTIDEITTAYDTLSEPARRVEYDRTLAQREHPGWKHASGQKGTHTGVDAYDLADLEYDEVNNSWSKSCRCGDEIGYTLTESDLEKESQQGEVYVGCRGCSLFIKVLFAVEDM
jgi:diphthamide biosynthesis protein 4